MTLLHGVNYFVCLFVVPDDGSIVMFRMVGYTQCAWDKAVRLIKYPYSDRHCDVIQRRTVSPCFAFHLIQPEQEWESEKGKKVEQKIESFRLRCSSVLIGSIRHQSNCAAGLQWKMMTTRVSFFERRKATDSSRTSAHRAQQQAYRVPRSWGSKSGGPGFDSRLVKPRTLVEMPHNWAPSFESNAGFWINIAVSILGHFQFPS